MRHIIAIDGASRRNGTPSCISSAGAFVKVENDANQAVSFACLTDYEICSTNQRGEMLALRRSLVYAKEQHATELYIITDSEYLFNTMTKDWLGSWKRKGWVTSLGAAVKNKDIWEQIDEAYTALYGIEIVFYHIKGHLASFGKVTGSNLLDSDKTGASLYEAVAIKVASAGIKPDLLAHAQEVWQRNNGFAISEEDISSFVVLNTVADAIATYKIEAVEALR